MTVVNLKWFQKTSKDAVTVSKPQLFNSKWLLNQDILAKINPENGVEAIKSMQDATLNSLLQGIEWFDLWKRPL
jgi:hypothetical protein